MSKLITLSGSALLLAVMSFGAMADSEVPGWDSFCEVRKDLCEQAELACEMQEDKPCSEIKEDYIRSPQKYE